MRRTHTFKVRLYPWSAENQSVQTVIPSRIGDKAVKIFATQDPGNRLAQCWCASCYRIQLAGLPRAADAEAFAQFCQVHHSRTTTGQRTSPIVLGGNGQEDMILRSTVLSNASCTTNCQLQSSRF